ncbi:MAG TPA: hypothetical protein VNQ14_13910, partial [Woeseiaceae bacterium]|nr:hypothetical protein [Woeseiaceae bacterium]
MRLVARDAGSYSRFDKALLIVGCILLAGCLPGIVAGADSPDEPRQKISLNAGWSFSLDAPDAGSWQPVDLPHSWNATDGRDKKKPYHRG